MNPQITTVPPRLPELQVSAVSAATLRCDHRQDFSKWLSVARLEIL